MPAIILAVFLGVCMSYVPSWVSFPAADLAHVAYIPSGFCLPVL